MKDKKNDRLGRIERGLKDFLRSMAELREEQKKTDEQIKSLTQKTDEEIRKTEKLVEQTNKQVGDLTDGWGKFVEGLVEPSLPVVFKKLGLLVYGIGQNVTRHKNGESMEIDLLGVGRRNGRPIVLVVKAKSQLVIRDVKDFEERYTRFEEFFGEYSSYKKIGVVCGVRLREEVVRYASKRGFYVLGVSGDAMVLKATPRTLK